MKRGIGPTLISGYLIFIALMAALTGYSISASQKSLRDAVGKSSVFLADEMLTRMNMAIYTHIGALRSHLQHEELQKTVIASNQSFERMENIEDYINRRDREWISANDISPFMRELIDNELTRMLVTSFVEPGENQYGYRVFKEIIVTNKYGAIAAATGITSDYRQNDETWWQLARARGLHVTDVEYDQSSDTQAISLILRLNDAQGNFIGVLKAVLAFRAVIRDVEMDVQKYETSRIKLLTQEGQLLYQTTAFVFLEDQTGQGFFSQVKGENGYFISESGGRRRLFSYTRSRGYKDFEGLHWILILSHDLREVLRPAHLLRNNMLIISLALIAVASITALFFYLSIVRTERLIRASEARINNLNTRLQQRSEALERSNRDLEQFAYVASHDLQEPLRAVAGFAELLEMRYKDKLDPQANEFIEFIVGGARRLQTMINDLLSFSRITTRGGEFKEVDCHMVLGQALANLNSAIEESRAIITNQDLPMVKGDEFQLVHLFQNLIGNAIKFRGDRPPHIHISAREEENEWVLAVSDNGIGIEPQYFDRIFVIFQSLHNRSQYPGTGIGLAFCKKVVERHGGRIWLESRPGEGTTFYFSLPRSDLEKNAAANPDRSKSP